MHKNKTADLQIKLPVLAAATALALTAMSAEAFQFDTGNSDLAIRWDNTVKLNVAKRMVGQDPHIAKSANYNDGDLSFDKGAMTSERVDLYSELELSYQKKMGFRLSGAAWYDGAYEGNDNPNPTPNHLVNGKPAKGLSQYTNRYAHGPSGELLDAYLFRNFDFGEQKLNLTAGKSLQSWGNSAHTLLHGINYGQFPIELGKLFSIPRLERNEVFLPRNQLTADFTFSPQWSFGAQYFLDWQHSRFPEAGSYMGMYDIALDGAEMAYVPASISPNGIVTHGRDLTPDKTGDFGVNAKWSPTWLGGTLGFYYRRTADSLPDTVLIDKANKQYKIAYAGGIDIYGLSLSKNIADVKVGADLSFRDNMPLASQSFIVVVPGAKSSPGVIGAMPGDGQTGGAVGRTLHAALNATKAFGKTPVFDKAVLQGELTWNRLVSVTEGYDQYRGNPAYTGIDRSTKDFYGMSVNFVPTWNQVFQGVDLSAPLSYAVGLKGQSSVPLGGNQGTGNYSVGLAALVDKKYQFDLKYTGFFGSYATAANGSVSSFAGLMSLLKDRNTLSLTFKTKF